MADQVRITDRQAALIVSKRIPVRLAEIGSVIGGAFGEIYGQLQARGGVAKGPPFVIYHGTPQADDPFDVEVCAPVGTAVDPPEGWRVGELPAGTFVTVLHVGPYETLGAAYATLAEWTGSHDLAVAGPPREVYLSEPGTPPDQVKTIVELPVTPLAAPIATG